MCQVKGNLTGTDVRYQEYNKTVNLSLTACRKALLGNDEEKIGSLISVALKSKMDDWKTIYHVKINEKEGFSSIWIDKGYRICKTVELKGRSIS